MPVDPDEGTPAYAEPLDSELIDPDPDFRETLKLLNEVGVQTVSSCQGHAPGTQYEDVRGWMSPYVTCRVAPEKVMRACEYLRAVGEDQWAELRVIPGAPGEFYKILVKFPLGWEWKRSVAFMKAKMPWRPA